MTYATPLSQNEIDETANQLQVTVADYLYQELSNTDFGTGTNLQGFSLDVIPPSFNSSMQNNGGRLRFLQSTQSLNFTVNGTAKFDIVDASTVDTSTLTNQVDASVNQAFASPESQAQFSEYLQTSGQDPLNMTQGASVETQSANDNSVGRPSTAAIVCGFVLVALAALSLMGYCFVWCKSRRKTAAQRKRDREGIPATSNKFPGPVSRPSKNNRQFVPPPMVPVMTQATRLDEDSSEGSSYEGVDSVSEESNDLFAKELQLAANLDRQAWADFQQQQKSLDDNEVVVRDVETGKDTGTAEGSAAAVAGGAVALGLYSKQSKEEDEGMEIVDIGSQSRLIIRPTGDNDYFEPYGDSTAREIVASSSFPYGDENSQVHQSPSRQDPPAPRGSTRDFDVRHMDPIGLRASQVVTAYQAEQGVEWTTAGIATDLEHGESIEDWTADKGSYQHGPYGKARHEERRWSIIDNTGEEDNDAALMLMSALTAGTSLRKNSKHGKESPTTFGDDPAQEAAVAGRALENLRASPNSSFTGSAPSNQAVRMSPDHARQPNVSAMTAPVSSSRTISDSITEDLPQSKGSSLLTLDIVKEVEKLSRFVRRYERKREKKKGNGEIQDKNAVAESRSIPSVGYDAFSDSVSAMKVIPPPDNYGADEDRSGLRASYGVKTLSIRQVEVDPSETDESSQNSWSTHSEIERLLDDNSNNNNDEPLIDEQYQERMVKSSQFEGVDYGESEDDDQSFDNSEGNSDDSRLGITPFNVQQLMANHNAEMGSFPVPSKADGRLRSDRLREVRVSRPPLTGNPLSSTLLSPIAGTPVSAGEFTPKSRNSPLADVTRHINSDFSESPPLKWHKSPSSPIDSEPVSRVLHFQESTMQFGQKPNESKNAMSEKGATVDNSRNEEDKIMRGNPRQPTGKTRTLSELRMRDAILDEADSEVIVGMPNSNPDVAPLSPPVISPALDTPVIPSPSTKGGTPRKMRNQGFSSILSMFENKQKEAIFPPNENWQYNSSATKRK